MNDTISRDVPILLNQKSCDPEITDEQFSMLDTLDQMDQLDDMMKYAYQDLITFCKNDPVVCGTDFCAYLTEGQFVEWIMKNSKVFN